MYSSHQSNSEKESTSHTSSTRKQAHNRTGIPDQVKAKYEQHSGYSFDDVRIHYNSGMPAQFHAFAFTQGNNVYIGPQQEGYLNHELGHVVQQKQGRVPVESYYNGVAINKDSALEREADNFLSYAPVRRQGEIQDNNTFADNLTFSSNLGNNGGIYDSGIMQCAWFMRALAYEENFPLEVKALCSKENWIKKRDQFISDKDIDNMVDLSLEGAKIDKLKPENKTIIDEKTTTLKKERDENINLLYYLDGLAGASASIYVENGTYIYPVGYMLDIVDKNSVYANYLQDARTTKPGLRILGKIIFDEIIEKYYISSELKENFGIFSGKSNFDDFKDIFYFEGKNQPVAGDFEYYIREFLEDYFEIDADKIEIYKTDYTKNKKINTVKNIVTSTIDHHLAEYYYPSNPEVRKDIDAKTKVHNYGAGFDAYSFIASQLKASQLKDSVDMNSYSESIINAKIEDVCCVWYDDRNIASFDNRSIDPKWKAKSSPSIAAAKPIQEVLKCRLTSAENLANQLSEGKKKTVKVVPLSKL